MKFDFHQLYNTKSAVFCLLVFLLFVSPARGNDVVSSKCTGIWAASGGRPYVVGESTPNDVTAPNGELLLRGTYEGLVLAEGNRHFLIDWQVNPPLTEVLWAPDSKSFAINVSDGGLIGSWETRVYTVGKDGRPVRRDVEKYIRPYSKKLLHCEPGETANLGVVTWLNKSKEVLMIVAVPNHSTCRNMGSIFGFVVSIDSGKILKRVSARNLRQKWDSVLGCWFGE